MALQRASRRNTPRATISPTIADLHWAAGFLEGEGNFAGRSHRNRAWIVCVRAVQVQLEPLGKLQQLFGGTIKLKSPQKIGHQAIWVWQVNGTRARGVMMTLYKLMSTRRREQIHHALSGCKPGPVVTEETRRQRVEIGRRRYKEGRWVPPVLQRPMDEEWRGRISATQKKIYAEGKTPVSKLPGVGAKISQSLRGRRLTEEQKRRVGDYWRGRKKSPEQKAKMAEARKRWWGRNRQGMPPNQTTLIA